MSIDYQAEGLKPELGDFARGAWSFLADDQWRGRIEAIEWDEAREDHWISIRREDDSIFRTRAGSHGITWIYLKEPRVSELPD